MFQIEATIITGFVWTLAFVPTAATHIDEANMDSSDFVEAPLNPNLNDLLEAAKHQNSSGFFEVLNSYTTWPVVLAAVLMFFAYYFLWIVKVGPQL